MPDADLDTLTRIAQEAQALREGPLSASAEEFAQRPATGYLYGPELSPPTVLAMLDVVRAAELAISVSVCDFPDGACDIECGRTADDHSGCLRIKALAALAKLVQP